MVSRTKTETLKEGPLRAENEKLARENADLHSQLIRVQDENAAQ